MRAVRFILDGREAGAGAGEMLLPAALRAGARIPHLCHVEGLRPYAACRLCLVEVGQGERTRIVTACDYPVRDGVRVATASARVIALRRSVAALHLARAPGSPEIREIARSLDVEEPAGLRVRDPAERCILCGLCVRACADLVGAHAIGMAGRGGLKRVSLPYGEESGRECIGCGACAAVCPTHCIEIAPLAIGRLRYTWGQDRPCRHSLMGLAPGTVCSHDYDCASCPFDHEMIDRAGGRHPAFLLGGGRP